MCSRHCIGTFWDKIVITFYEVVANYSVPETWSKHRHLKTYILHLVFLCQQLSPAAKNWSGKPIQCLQRWKAKMYWIDWTSTFSEMNFLCKVSQNCVDRYVSTELCWGSPGETDAGMQRCDVIIGGTHTVLELRERLGLSSPLKPTVHSSPGCISALSRAALASTGPCLSFNHPPAPGPGQLHCHGGGEMAASASPPAALWQDTCYGYCKI